MTVTCCCCRRRHTIKTRRDRSKNADEGFFFHGRALQPSPSAIGRGRSVVFWPLQNELAAVSNPPPHFICCDSSPQTKRSDALTDGSHFATVGLTGKISPYSQISMLCRANLRLKGTLAWGAKSVNHATCRSDICSAEQ